MVWSYGDRISIFTSSSSLPSTAVIHGSTVSKAWISIDNSGGQRCSINTAFSGWASYRNAVNEAIVDWFWSEPFDVHAGHPAIRTQTQLSCPCPKARIFMPGLLV
jgi:hypothetical protein